MTSPEETPAVRKLADGTTEEDLLAEGWQRAFIADEPRLSEAVETYIEIGWEVALLPVPEEDGQCTECMKEDPGRFRLIFIRRPDGSPAEGG